MPDREYIDPKALTGEAPPPEMPPRTVLIPDLPGAQAIADGYEADGWRVLWAPRRTDPDRRNMTDEHADYPEHEKLRAIQSQSQLLGEFLDEWCSARGIELCRLVDSGKRTGFRGDDDRDVVMEYSPVTSTHRLLAEFFGIDLAKIEQEKRAMLAALERAR
jgi:hypothetical protein